MNKLKIALAMLLPLILNAAPAAAQSCELSISGNDMIQFDKSELVVPANCQEVTLTLTHTGMLPVEQMGHNWVLTGSDGWQTLAQDAMTAGKANDYIPPDDDRIITHTALIGGGEMTSITFDVSGLDRSKDYTFFCSFPGHYANMNGTFILEGGS